MKCLLGSILLVFLAVPCMSQELRVIAARRCSSGFTMEVRFSNLQYRDGISTPLSGNYQAGHTLHSVRAQFYDLDGKTWKFTERGLDNLPAGTRVLELGEAVNEIVSASSERIEAKVLEKVKFRVGVSFQISGERRIRTAFSAPFTLEDLKDERFTSEPWIVQELSRWCR